MIDLSRYANIGLLAIAWPLNSAIAIEFGGANAEISSDLFDPEISRLLVFRHDYLLIQISSILFILSMDKVSPAVTNWIW